MITLHDIHGSPVSRFILPDGFDPALILAFVVANAQARGLSVTTSGIDGRIVTKAIHMLADTSGIGHRAAA